MDSIEEKRYPDFQTIYSDELTNRYNSNDFSKPFRHINEHQLIYNAYFTPRLDLKFEPKVRDRRLAEKYCMSQNIEYHSSFSVPGLRRLANVCRQRCDLSPEELFNILKDEYKPKQ